MSLIAASTVPSRHCFREGWECPEHGVLDQESDICCCCGWLAKDHTGCDCDDTSDIEGTPWALGINA